MSAHDMFLNNFHQVIVLCLLVLCSISFFSCSHRFISSVFSLWLWALDEGYSFERYLMKVIPLSTWWRLFLERYLMKVIPLSTWWRLFLWAHDEGYSFERYLMKVIPLSVLDECYSFERTWWRLLLWAYLMQVIPLNVLDEV